MRTALNIESQMIYEEGGCDLVIKHKPLPEVSVVTNPTWSASSVTVAGNKKQGISDIQLNMPQGICVDQHGGHIIFEWTINLYVADRDNHRIQRFEPDSVIGETIAGENNGFGLASNHLYHPADIFVDSAGNLFVADQSNNRIQKFSRNSKQGITVAKCTSPRAIFVTKHGDLYVSEFDKVMKYSLSNSTLETVVAENLEDARGIFVVEGKLDNDSLYVADRAHHCIQKFVLGSNMKGVIVAGVKGEQGLDANYLNFPNDVILDSFGNLYIADHGNHRIQRVNVQDGTTETIAGVTGRKSKSDHHLAYPKSLAFDSKLNLYVSDTYNRVQKFAIEGEYVSY
ncbi:hypothetical protein I4U23_022130 [Adineta vaga]|nr:hypothetical protein I4U23_022130 [Adineta vaga]